MGRKASGAERVDLIEKKQANGTVYVYRRISAYNKEKGYYVSKEQKLLGKKDAETGEIVPTRPKAPNGTRRKYASDNKENSAGVAASRIRAGASAIAAHIGAASGIDADVYASCDEATAKKIIALARYYLMSDGEAISHIGKWQLTHEMEPYGYPISEDAAHDLFRRVGSDERIPQGIFLSRAARLDGAQVLAYDSIHSLHLWAEPRQGKVWIQQGWGRTGNRQIVHILLHILWAACMLYDSPREHTGCHCCWQRHKAIGSAGARAIRGGYRLRVLFGGQSFIAAAGLFPFYHLCAARCEMGAARS